MTGMLTKSPKTEIPHAPAVTGHSFVCANTPFLQVSQSRHQIKKSTTQICNNVRPFRRPRYRATQSHPHNFPSALGRLCFLYTRAQNSPKRFTKLSNVFSVFAPSSPHQHD